MFARIEAISYHFPQLRVGNEQLAAQSEQWSANQIFEKTGIQERPVTSTEEFTSDLATQAGKKLFAEHSISPETIDFLIVCTQTPDHLLPGTSALVHEQLSLPKSTGAFDINLGCSGYVYSLSVAKGLVESGQVRNVLLITADTYSKLLPEEDLSVRTLFGDASAATLISRNSETVTLDNFVFGTDGSGAEYLMAHGGGLRPSKSGSQPTLTMDGPSIFHFTLEAVPKLVNGVLEKSGKQLDDIDQFVFHQANQFMLEHLRKKLKISEERFVLALDDCGNTVSSSIPVALAKAKQRGQIREGTTAMLVGFGVGLSWAGCVATL